MSSVNGNLALFDHGREEEAYHSQARTGFFSLLVQFPEGYRHLAYLQTKIGYKVKPDMPGLDGPEVDQLYGDGAAWLAGEKLRR